jgi:hypothetical protein
MTWIVLAVAFYAFFQLFRANTALGLAMSTMRVSLIALLFVAHQFGSGIPFVSTLFVFSVCALAMMMIRRETQVEDQSDSEAP